jgi:hypothetical protein
MIFLYKIVFIVDPEGFKGTGPRERIYLFIKLKVRSKYKTDSLLVFLDS